jgi:mannose-6-phosphate isomerase-like protein (cupin superfamily)
MRRAAHTVVRTAEIQAEQIPGGALLRTLVETGPGDSGLVRRQAELTARTRLSGRASGAGELWFVLEGTGMLDVPGQSAVRLQPDRGVLLEPGCSYDVLAGDAQEPLRLDLVSLPATAGGGAGTGAGEANMTAPLSRDFAECELETTGDRQFRVLFGPGMDCAVATQFVGEIPPGRAPDHSHPYDEVVLVLGGRGIAHIGGAEHVIAAGTCAHLPPGLVHCLENTGSDMLRVLGVFHPADSPAAKLAGGQ